MRWTLKTIPNITTVQQLSKDLSIDDTLSKLLIQRGISTFEEAKKFFRPSLEELHDPFLLKDMDLAVSRIEKAIASNENILIYFLSKNYNPKHQKGIFWKDNKLKIKLLI